jgi:hypothetical protein
MAYVAPTYTPDNVVKTISDLPRFGGSNTFDPSFGETAVSDYWLGSVGMLAGMAAIILITCNICMWCFTYCFCCRCCQRRCYCARCCCCTRHNKKFYATLCFLAVASLYFLAAARSSCQDMLDNMSVAFTACGTLLDAIGDKIRDYSTQFTVMKQEVDDATGNCDAQMKSDLSTYLFQISSKMGAVKLPVGSTMVEPMLKALKTTDFPPSAEQLENGEGILAFGFDSGLAIIGGMLGTIAFLACFANYQSPRYNKGCCRCMKCCYIFLVLILGTVVVILNLVIGGMLMYLAVAVADMCMANPDTVFSGLFNGNGALKDAGIGDVLYWTTCPADASKNPLSILLDQVDVPINMLSNNARNGIWDSLPQQCQDEVTSIGKHCGTNPTDGMSCATADGALLPLSDTTTPAERCISRETLWEFRDIFGCPGNQYVTSQGGTTPKGGLNMVYNQFVYNALCTDLVGAFFYLWAAISLSSFFILFAFFVLPCTTRKGGVDFAGDGPDGGEEKYNPNFPNGKAPEKV